MSIRDTLSRIFKRNPVGDLKHLTESVDNSIKTVSDDLNLLELELVIGSSTGEWLDEWGSWFGIPRLLNEEDSSYRNRILAVATKPKNTVPALIEAVRTYLGNPELNVQVYEPHNNIMKYSVSAYSGLDKYQDNEYQRFAVVDIIVPTNTPGVMQNIVEPVKSAGVKAYFTRMDVIGDGKPVKTYSDREPESDQYLWTQMKEIRTDIPIYSGAYVDLPLSGRQVTFSTMERHTELFKKVPISIDGTQDGIGTSYDNLYAYYPIPARRSHVNSATISLDDSVLGEDWETLHDDFFNSVYYTKETTLFLVMLEEVIVTGETVKTTQLYVKTTPDVFANSQMPINILLDTSIKDGYYHDTDYSSEHELTSHQFRNLYCGSAVSMASFIDSPIGETEDSTSYRYDTQMGVQSETIPV